jgi:hypothetical protein
MQKICFDRSADRTPKQTQWCVELFKEDSGVLSHFFVILWSERMQNVLRGWKGDSVSHELIKQNDLTRTKQNSAFHTETCVFRGMPAKQLTPAHSLPQVALSSPHPCCLAVNHVSITHNSKATSQVLYKTHFSKVHVVLNALVRINPSA